MAKSKAPKPINCSICGAPVEVEAYAAHVQQFHTAAPVAAPAPTQYAQPPQQGGYAPQQTGNNNQPLQPMSGPILGKDIAGGNYLKGADVPDGTMDVRFKVLSFVRDPQGRSKLAAQITETYGKTLFGFNTTNIRALMGLGFPDMQMIVNKTMVCMIGMQPNPQQGGKLTKALFVSRVE